MNEQLHEREFRTRRQRPRRVAAGATAGMLAVLVIIVSSMLSGPTDNSRTSRAPVLSGGQALNPGHYELLIGRDLNVVVVLETSAIADRPHFRLDLAMTSAIPDGREVCENNETGCDRTSTPVPRLHILPPEGTLTQANLAEFAALGIRVAGAHPWEKSTRTIPTMTDCSPQLDDFGRADLQVASYGAASIGPAIAETVALPLDGVYLIEFVARFESQEQAAAAFDTLHGRAFAGPCLASYRIHQPFLDGDDPHIMDAVVDQAFGAEFTRWPRSSS